MDHQFRSVAFGGFHKQDVLNFLESNAREHTQQVEQLQEQLEERGQELSQAQTREEENLSRALKAEEELDSLKGKCARQEEELKELRRLKEEQKTRLKELEDKVARLEPDAQAYGIIKERTAGVELEAHRRAQGVEDRAARKADRLRKDAGDWLLAVEKDYDQLHTQVETTVAHANAQLQRAEQSLSQIGQLMGRQADQLDQLKRAWFGQGQQESVSPEAGKE